MGKEKFQPVLQAGADEEKARERRQDKLKEKFGFTGKDVVIIEKENTLKFTIKTITGLVRFLATVMIIGLAFIGMIALFYGEPRAALGNVFNSVLDETCRDVPVIAEILGMLHC